MTSSTVSADNLAALQRSIGYQFTDLGLLQQALTHKSHSKTNNERVEFVGDAVLGYPRWQHAFPKLSSRSRGCIVVDAGAFRARQNACAGRHKDRFARVPAARLWRAAIWWPPTGIDFGRCSLEAVIGAVHEDGGIEQAQRLVQKLFADLTEGLDAESLKDPKTRLQELAQGNGLDLPTYTVEQVSGADHQRQYTVKCEVPSLALQAVAADSSRRAAEKAAAHEVPLILALAQQRVSRSQQEKSRKRKPRPTPKSMSATMIKRRSKTPRFRIRHQLGQRLILYWLTAPTKSSGDYG